ncbi:MAG: hypothetical protein E7812_14320 [Phenylobacterium sp.]|nr:MAG: hypothetical protein E7812_14320 [Phenylobacterium sp.]
MLVAELLTGLLPNVMRSRRLGELDCIGIDVAQHDTGSDSVALAIQCKGFELAVGPRQTAACVADIQKFRRLGPRVPTYWLVVNRRVSDEARSEIDAELKQLVQSGKADVARLLDLESFVDELRSLARECLGNWAAQARSRLAEQFQERLGVVRYISDVPFERGNEMNEWPADWMNRDIRKYLGAIHPEHIGKDRSPPRFLVTASFGFGKTSTLHAVAEDWIGCSGHVIYVPAALLADEAFVNGAGLTESLLDQITPPGWTAPQQVAFILRETLRKDLARSREWLLLIDGIDECVYWSDARRLSALWGGVVDLGLPLVASVRDELFQLRRSEFEAGDGRSFGRPFFDIVALLDWSDELILEFLARYKQAQADPVPEAFVRLESVVASGYYVHTYGDIPKRPLFLGMLAEDAWRDEQPETELHLLYGKYLRRKLHLDRHSPGAGAVVRTGELASRFGAEEEAERIIHAMEDVALAIAGSEIGEEGATIGEDQLRQILRAVSAEVERIEEIALNSLLLPAGRDPVTRARRFRFAHQSFQDWFVARHLVSSGGLPDPAIHNQAVRAFAVRMLATNATKGLSAI